MAKSAVVKARMEPKLKEQGEEILSTLGLNPTTAITLFYTQIVRQRGLPLELKIPNEETVAALGEDVSQTKSYESADELFADLEADGK